MFWRRAAFNIRWAKTYCNLPFCTVPTGTLLTSSLFLLLLLLVYRRETLRKDTIVPALSRIADKDFELNGYAVPEGTSITVPLKYFSLHDPRWVNAEGELSPSAFNPERMLTPEGSKPGWQMPFGYGPR